VGHHRTTIEREISANGGRDGYRADLADDRGAVLRSRPRKPLLATDGPSKTVVETELAAGRSPAAIAHTIRPANMIDATAPMVMVSTETIYQALFNGVLTVKPQDCLRTRRPRRRRRNRCATTTTHVLGLFTPIAQRPAVIETRLVAGAWEGDLIIVARNASAAITLVERASRLCAMIALPDGYQADMVAEALDRWTSEKPGNELVSITWDRGSEMAQWRNLTVQWGVEIYFADPHSPWQRGTSQHTNRQLRWWFPKGTNLATITQHAMNQACDLLNNQPRRLHHWQTPAHIYNQLTAL
jgi:transposase, IS30 family